MSRTIGGGGEELSALGAFREGELAQEVLVDQPKPISSITSGKGRSTRKSSPRMSSGMRE